MARTVSPCLAPLRPWAVLGLLAVGLIVGARPADAGAPPKTCKQCRVQCREEAALAACIQSDPRLATCSERRRNFCLKRARRACQRNLKTCCRRQCRTTGLVQCCGSAVSTTPTTAPSSGSSSTTTTGPLGSTSTTTTTTMPGQPQCTSDADCPSCQCCNVVGRCAGADGGSTTQCCSTPNTPPPVCGPKSPGACPAEATCPPPGQLLGGTYYWCQYCARSGNIIEVLVPSGTVPPLSTPSNACTRR